MEADTHSGRVPPHFRGITLTCRGTIPVVHHFKVVALKYVETDGAQQVLAHQLIGRVKHICKIFDTYSIRDEKQTVLLTHGTAKPA